MNEGISLPARRATGDRSSETSTSSSATVSNRTSVCRSLPPPRCGRALPRTPAGRTPGRSAGSTPGSAGRGLEDATLAAYFDCGQPVSNPPRGFRAAYSRAGGSASPGDGGLLSVCQSSPELSHTATPLTGEALVVVGELEPLGTAL